MTGSEFGACCEQQQCPLAVACQTLPLNLLSGARLAGFCLSITILEILQLEQFPRIVLSYFPPVNIIDLRIIIPVTGVLEVFKGIVDGKQDSIRTDLCHAIMKSWRRKVATRGNPDILREIFSDGFLTGLLQPQRLLDILEPVIDPPEIERQVLPEVPYHHL